MYVLWQIPQPHLLASGSQPLSGRVACALHIRIAGALALHGVKYTTFIFLAAVFPYLGHALVLLIVGTCCRAFTLWVTDEYNIIQVCRSSLRIWDIIRLEWSVSLSSNFWADWQVWTPSSAISLDWEQTALILSAQAGSQEDLLFAFPGDNFLLISAHC